jgi:ring-1,2-phenylacetyl-CoA epoxidase subunit PaaB
VTVFEVFRQERRGQPFQHAGSVEAPNPGFAEVYAREQYGRRGESEALWLVPREAVRVVVPPRRRLLDQGQAEGGA